jgi:hypothetical protein
MPRLFLHIGTHKTGSTAQQQLLHQHREALAVEGIFYPETGLQKHAHHQLAWASGARRPAVDAGFLASAFEKIAGQARHSGDTVVLSSEEFEFTPDPAVLAALKKSFEVSVVIYLRKQDHCLEAAYNQHVRSYDLRFTGSIYQFALKYDFFRRYDYAALLQPWADVFGSQNLLVRPYGSSLVGSDACADLFSLIGVSPELNRQLCGDGLRVNRALPASAIPYMARINSMTLDKSQHQGAQGILREQMAHTGGGRFLRPHEAAEFYAHFIPGNEEVFGHYMGLAEDPLATLDDTEDADNWVSHEAVDTEVLLALAEGIFQPAGRARLKKLLER